MIKAIETEYNGYKFRSRLEARWAVFFDALHIKYRYEDEGYEIGQTYGDHAPFYLPDFYLPDLDIYAEVKGSNEQLESDSDKLGDAIDYCSTPMSEKGLIILGQIPYFEDIEAFPYFDFLYWYKGVCSGKCLFSIGSDGGKLEHNGFYGSKEPTKNWHLFNIHDGLDVGAPIPSSVSTIPKWQHLGLSLIADRRFFEPLHYALRKARQARFEHGEKPCFNTPSKVSEDEIPF